MPLILSIDTAMEHAGVCLHDGYAVTAIRSSNRQMEHAAWIHVAIKELLEEAGKQTGDLQAVAVTEGPGSYTGLRVGMATAKGLCFALNIPLITESTLRLMAFAVRKEIADVGYSYPVWICAMIDARRMEVFTAIFDEDLVEKMPPWALILEEHSYADYLLQHPVFFAGNGSAKWQMICSHPNAVFSAATYSVRDLALMAAEKFESNEFAELAYSDPVYLKNVYMPAEAPPPLQK